MKVTGEFHQSAEFEHFIAKIKGDAIPRAASIGLNEHADEQRRQSVVRISSYTGVPASRVRAKTRVKRSSPGFLEAEVITADKAIMLSEYGSPVWTRDRTPGWKGGSVSSMAGAEATGWNVRRVFKHAFIANGQVVVRTGPQRDASLKVLSMAVLANELAKPTRPNVPAAEKFVRLDLEKRVTRQILRLLGT